MALADGIVKPYVTEALLAGDPAAIARMDDVVLRFIVREPVLRVKVWTMDGLIVYADDHRLIGRRFDIDKEALDAVARGETYAHITDLTDAENEFERGQGRLLEVYRPLDVDHRPFLYEHYQRLTAVTAGAHRVWAVFAPLLIGSLAVLQLMQLPLAWSLARRMRAAQRQRVALLQRAIDASEEERRRIARDLHDGIVQDLIGASYAVGVVLQESGTARSPEADATLRDVMAATQRSIKGLRTLLVDIYPPSLEEGDLDGALTDLVSPYAARDIAATVTFDVAGHLSPSTAALVYRAVREAMHNVARHARATTVAVTVRDLDDREIELTVTDDGIGFDTDTLRARADEGHVGVRLLSDLASNAGGRIDVVSSPGAGTTVRLRAPR